MLSSADMYGLILPRSRCMVRIIAAFVVENYQHPSKGVYVNKVEKHDGLWSIVLAGGEGERLRPFVERWLGRHRPKQYCAFVGTRSMLQHTLDRADRLAHPECKVTVVARSHRQAGWATPGGVASGIVVAQPGNCDTAAGIFLPLAYVRARDPHATVVIYPSDHFVYPEERFVESVRSAVQAAEKIKDRLVLLAASPDSADPELGWILPGARLNGSNGRDVRAVEAFIEKPRVEVARRAMTSGALWNTLVLAAKADLLWSLGWRYLPEMMPLFDRLSAAIGTEEEDDAMVRVYGRMPSRNFSSDLLARATDQAAVIELSGVLWNDWGKSERIVDSLRRIGRAPVFSLKHLSDRPTSGTGEENLLKAEC